MAAYKDIDAKEMAVLARIIVDQNDTAKQKKCIFCHKIIDRKTLKQTLKIMSEPELSGIEWSGTFYHSKVGFLATVKLSDSFYQLEYNVDQGKYDLRAIQYCDQCGRFLKD